MNERPQAAGDAAEVRRQAILAAAGAVFMTKGYAGATTLEIARLARTSKRALYQHFASKRAILDRIVLERSRKMMAPIDMTAPDSKIAFFETITSFGVVFLSRLVEPTTIALYRLAICEAGPSNDLGQALEASGRALVVEGMRRFLGEGAARGWLEADDLDALTETYFDLLIGSVTMGQLLRTDAAPDGALISRRAERAATALTLLAKSF